MSIKQLIGDVMQHLPGLADESVHCVVTSPPYYGLRDYGMPGQIGLEADYRDYIKTMVAVFREVRRVLRKDGTLWCNLGDSYAGSWGAQSGKHAGKHAPNVSALSANQVKAAAIRESGTGSLARTPGLKPKDLIGIPWRMAFGLQEDGWWLRQSLPWVKRNPMPESTDDRPTNAVEYVFQLTKAERYFYDYAAVQRIASASTHARLAQAVEKQNGSARANGGAKSNGNMKAVRAKQDGHGRRHAGFNERYFDVPESSDMPEKRAFRNSDLFFDSLGPVTDQDGTIIALDVTTQPFKGAHTVLDPFAGAGTTGLVADRLNRNAILIEINPAYAAMARDRIAADAPLFADVSAA